MEDVMAKCISCRKEVDDSAETCSHCGASMTEPVVQDKPHCGTPSVPKK
ncbi:MAG: zinc-ribbon domain-containing protein [Thermoleophilia bacterium]|jgi:predicted amidophosphoribosyltransferase|nr:zinc-ribbon domain-containing protein [Thermoleophilia bacterium]